jgi:uncharacterized flavoprotein (TIGR03862 family)
LRFATSQGEQHANPDAVVLALGGASWARLGSDGAWWPWLQARQVPLAPLRAANCGFDVGWSTHFAERFAGHPFKSVALSFTDRQGRSFARKGEFVATATGIDGSLVYAASALLRDEIDASGGEGATCHIDLLPDRSAAQVLAAVNHPRGARSLSSHLKSRLGLDGIKSGLLREQLTREEMHQPQRLAEAIKSLPLRVRAARPVDEAISTAGGVRFDALDPNLMLAALPGVFCAGEMLDWEAPTGGYLLTLSMASGAAAARSALRWT